MRTVAATPPAGRLAQENAICVPPAGGLNAAARAAIALGDAITTATDGTDRAALALAQFLIGGTLVLALTGCWIGGRSIGATYRTLALAGVLVEDLGRRAGLLVRAYARSVLASGLAPGADLAAEAAVFGVAIRVDAQVAGAVEQPRGTRALARQLVEDLVPRTLLRSADPVGTGLAEAGPGIAAGFLAAGLQVARAIT